MGGGGEEVKEQMLNEEVCFHAAEVWRDGGMDGWKHQQPESSLGGGGAVVQTSVLGSEQKLSSRHQRTRDFWLHPEIPDVVGGETL